MRVFLPADRGREHARLADQPRQRQAEAERLANTTLSAVGDLLRGTAQISAGSVQRVLASERSGTIAREPPGPKKDAAPLGQVRGKGRSRLDSAQDTRENRARHTAPRQLKQLQAKE